MERIPTGIPALDELLQGGIPAGAAILVIGRPGTGKTILAHQVMFRNAADDAKAVYITTLAEPQVKVMRFQQEFRFFDPAKFQQSVIYHDLGSVLRRGGPVSALSTIDELLRRHQPKLMIIDTIKTLSDVFPSLTEFREFVLDLSLRLATWECTTLMLGEYGEEEINVRPECAIADGIIYLSGTEEPRYQRRFLRILKMRGTPYSGGANVFRISENGIEIFPRLNPEVMTRSYAESGDRISTGMAGLDEMMGGGIPRGSATLVSGSAGTGKTLLALHYAYAGLQAEEPVVCVTFEEHPAQIRRAARGVGLDLDSYIAAGRLHMVPVSPMELNVDEHVFEILDLARRTGAGRVIIDSISSFELGLRDRVKYTDHVWSMTDYFRSIGVSLMLTHEPQGSDSAAELTRQGISYVADNLLQLRYIEERKLIRRFLRVVKMRGSAHANTVRELVIGPGGMALESVP